MAGFPENPQDAERSAPSAEADRNLRSAAAPLAATFMVQTMASMSMFGVAVIAPVAAPEIGVDATLIGVFTSIAFSFGMLTGLPTGALASRYGGIRVSQATMLLALMGVAALTLATPVAAIASAILLGFCYGPVNPVCTHILAGVSPERWRPLIFSIKQTGMPAGTALAGVLLPFLVLAYDWRVAILAAGLLAALTAVAIQPLRARIDADRERGGVLRAGSVIAPLSLVLRTPRLRTLGLVGFVYSGAQVALSTFYVVYLTAALSLSLTTAGLLYTILQIGAVMGRILWGGVADRSYPADRVLVGLGVGTAIFAVLAGAMTPGWSCWSLAPASFLLGATSHGWNGVFASELVKYAPAGHVGEAASGIQFVSLAGVAAVPPAFGLVVTFGGGYGVAFAAAAAVMLAAALYLGAAFRRG